MGEAPPRIRRYSRGSARDLHRTRLDYPFHFPNRPQTDLRAPVFWNLLAIIQSNSKLTDALNKRQKSYAVVEQVGDIYSEHVPNFEPFVEYGAHQLYGKYEFEREKGANAAFAAFVEVLFSRHFLERGLTHCRQRNAFQSRENLS